MEKFEGYDIKKEEESLKKTLITILSHIHIMENDNIERDKTTATSSDGYSKSANNSQESANNSQKSGKNGKKARKNK